MQRSPLPYPCLACCGPITLSSPTAPLHALAPPPHHTQIHPSLTPHTPPHIPSNARRSISCWPTSSSYWGSQIAQQVPTLPAGVKWVDVEVAYVYA